MKCIILGATGLVGQQLLQQALANPEYSQVIAPTRKTLAAAREVAQPNCRLQQIAS